METMKTSVLRNSIHLTVLLVVLAISASSPAGAAEQARPNVVFIMVDDLGWSDVSYNGSKVYETPNVDRLSRQGKVFSDFYSGGPVCSPTRASIMTGKYTARTGVTTYLLAPDRDAPHVTPHLPVSEFTIAEAFKKNGYATGYFGKWHLGYESKYWAGNQGFDVAKGGIDLPWAWTLCYPDIEEAPTAKTWPKSHTRFFSPYHMTHLENGPEGEYLTERLTDETIRFIENSRDQPFFAFLSFHTVHTPLQAEPEKIEKYKKKIAGLGLGASKERDRQEKAFQNNADYAAMVEHMDENVGRLLKRLDELKLSENTIVVWTSDNGGKGSVTSNLPLRGMKHNLYEGGIRVPLIVRWPEKIAAGTSSSTPLISNDFYPTLLEMTGSPTEPQQHVDGVSFKDVLLGKEDSVDRKAIYWHYPHGRQEAAVREGRYKLLHRFKNDRVELYDLETDIGERNDLSEEKPELATRLLKMLKKWQDKVGARFEGDGKEDSKSTSDKKAASLLSSPVSGVANGDGDSAIHQAILPGRGVTPSIEQGYRPARSERYLASAEHRIPADMVVQGDSVVLTAVGPGLDRARHVRWSLKTAAGAAKLTPDQSDSLKASLLADAYGENVVVFDADVDGRHVQQTAVVRVEFSTGTLVAKGDKVAMPPNADENPFVRPYERELFGHREQVTASNPDTGRLITMWQVKFGSGDAAPMGVAVMHSDDHGITWENRRYLFIQEPSNSGWGSVGWNPNGNSGRGEFLLWACSHVRIDDNRLMLFRSRNNGESWDFVGDYAQQVGEALGEDNTDHIYFGVNRTVASSHGTLVSPMVCKQFARAIWSDDNGVTWNNSNIDNSFPHGNEDAIVETIDGGKLIMIARSVRGAPKRFESADGGRTWTVVESGLTVPMTTVNFGLARIDEPGHPRHGQIMHCAAATRRGPHQGRQMLLISLNSDTVDVAEDAWDTRLLLDYSANYSDLLYLPEDGSIYVTVETKNWGVPFTNWGDAPIRYFKFSPRYWQSLPKWSPESSQEASQ